MAACLPLQRFTAELSNKGKSTPPKKEKKYPVHGILKIEVQMLSYKKKKKDLLYVVPYPYSLNFFTV